MMTKGPLLLLLLSLPFVPVSVAALSSNKRGCVTSHSPQHCHSIDIVSVTAPIPKQS